MAPARMVPEFDPRTLPIDPILRKAVDVDVERASAAWPLVGRPRPQALFARTRYRSEEHFSGVPWPSTDMLQTHHL